MKKTVSATNKRFRVADRLNEDLEVVPPGYLGQRKYKYSIGSNFRCP